ncbi:hypothetical protein DSO57_1009299 [Entomophthora muscae]|uniref:Uncharacterized protein n=1 Tax=Entomophthora muscae TaxID=34485 RepID=A0ACC2RLI2_9FUNG|nr:hypothetical protein DSO57_1009299 [Entomophthora muscae]
MFLPTNKNPFNPSDFAIVTNGLCSGYVQFFPWPGTPTKANIFFPLAQFTTSQGNCSMPLDKGFPITLNYTLSNQESFLFNPITLYTTILNTNTDPTITFPKL